MNLAHEIERYSPLFYSRSKPVSISETGRQIRRRLGVATEKEIFLIITRGEAMGVNRAIRMFPAPPPDTERKEYR